MKIVSKNFYLEYIKLLTKHLHALDLKKIEKIKSIILKKIKLKKNIFICGNGGSAAIANHFLCDFNKGIKESSNKLLKPRIISLSNSIELITAISNDINYETIFTNQFENYVNKDDLLVLISCSGSSKNIKHIENFAIKKKIETIKLNGFLNKEKAKKKQIVLNINIKNYGICEDIFQSIMHMISQEIRSNYYKKFSFKKNIL